MDVLERDRCAAAMIALRPDWASNGIDRLKSLRNWLTEHLMDWSFTDAVLALSLVAIDSSSIGPARVLTDGPWKTILRHTTGVESVTAKMPGYSAPEPECGYPGCGVKRPHLAHMIPSEVPPHEWEQPRPFTPASKEQIDARKPQFTRQESSHGDV